MKPYSYYSSLTVEFPSRSNYTVRYYYKRGKMICVKKPFCEIEEVPPGAVEEVIFDEEGYKLHEKAYFEEKRRLEEEFKQDLIESAGLSNVEAAEKCFTLAKDYGGPYGLETVHDYFEEIAELIK
jgi:hypothetical protein